MNIVKKLIFFSLICLYSSSVFAQIEAELPLNDSLYNTIEESNELMFGDSPNSIKKSSYSLRKFCLPATAKIHPIGGLQWSFVVTQAMSIQYSEMNGSLMSNDEQFSPQFLYDLLPKSSSNSCQLEKTWAQDTKEILETIGTISLKDYPVQSFNCNRKPTNSQILKARRYCVRSFNKLFKTGNGNDEMSLGGKISIITSCLDRNHPVILCLKTDNQFSALKSEIWEPTFSSTPVTQTVIIIGYDKNLKLFEIAGLQGNRWGNQGFAKIRYRDLVYAFYGFEIVMNQLAMPSKKPLSQISNTKTNPRPNNISPATAAAEAFLSGELFLKEVVDYNKYRDAPMAYQKEGYFEPTKNYVLKSQFQLVSQMIQKGSYVYVFSIDPKGKAEIHYPYEWTTESYGLTVEPIKHTSPAIPSEVSQIVIPRPRIETDPNGNSQRIEQALNKDVAGTDWLVILYSDQRLENELNTLVGRLSGNNLNFIEQFKEVFGKRLIPQKEIKFDEARFKANSHNGYIVPMIIKLTAY